MRKQDEVTQFSYWFFIQNHNLLVQLEAKASVQVQASASVSVNTHSSFNGRYIPSKQKATLSFRDSHLFVMFSVQPGSDIPVNLIQIIDAWLQIRRVREMEIASRWQLN